MHSEYWNPLVPELTVGDIGESLHFYTAAGFKVRYRRSDPDFAYIELGAVHLMLEEEHDGAWRTAELQRPLGRGINLQIAVPNVRATAEAVRAAGFPLFRGLAESWYEVAPGGEVGHLEFLVQDPDGYLMRFAEVLGGRPRG